MTVDSGKVRFTGEVLWATMGSPVISPAYGLSDDERTKWMVQLLKPVRNGINPDRSDRRRSSTRLLYRGKSCRWDFDNWTYERRYSHPGDPLMHRDGWQSIDSTMVIYMKLCENLAYLICLLLITMIICDASNWMPRCRYTYWRPCHTEYNSDYYSRDQIKCSMAEIRMPNTMPNTTPNWIPNLFWSYTTEYTILNKIPTQTRRSRAMELQ
jgi:hypothetical protein